MELVLFVLTLVAALCTALLSGTFFAFSAFFMRALQGLSAERGIVAMQATIRAIKKPCFLVLFFGTAVLCAGLGALALLHLRAPGGAFSVLGALLFLVGAFAITMSRSLSLNKQLLAVAPDAPNMAGFWRYFQKAWVRWNHIRMITAFLACVCFILALVVMGNPLRS